MSFAPNRFLNLATPGVQALQPYLPGKPVAELEREYGIAMPSSWPPMKIRLAPVRWPWRLPGKY